MSRWRTRIPSCASSYHHDPYRLAALTGLGMVLSLTVLFTNRWDFPGKSVLVISTAILDVNPARYELAAAASASWPKHCAAPRRSTARSTPTCWT